MLLLLALTNVAIADELQLTAADLNSRGTMIGTQPTPDGKGVVIERGILVENDGPAAGFSYQPNEEVLKDGITVFQKLNLYYPRSRAADERVAKSPPERAYLLVGHTGKLLRASINGNEVVLPPPTAVGNYWKRYEIPGEHLRDGDNEIGLQGEGKIWIAREDERSEPRSASNVGPHSFKKVGGETLKLLGPKSDIAGEYYIRLYVDGYEWGALRTPVYDAANLSGELIPPPNVRVRRIRVEATGDSTGGEISAGIHLGAWNGLTENKPLLDIDETGLQKLPRFFQADVILNATAFDKTPRLDGLRIRAEISADEGWGVKLKMVGNQLPKMQSLTGQDFRFEELTHPKLAQFRRDYHLEEVVKGCRTDLERMERLAVWTSQQWTKGHLSSIYPKWDACEILKKHADGTPVGGFCQQFNIVFLQACEAFGMPGRCVSIGAGDHGVKIRSGHEVVEIWSNELNKWVYVDGQAAWYFVDKETREPLNLLELRERQLAALLDKPLRAESKRPVEVVVLAKSPYEWKGLTEWPAFTELRMIPHTQFLDGELPLPLNQGMRGWFWTGHRVWTDDLYPASVLYSNLVTSSNDWNFPINQTQIWLQQNTKVGELDVRCEHNMPSFAKYELQFDDQPPQFAEKAEFQWPLHAGENRLQVRAVNKLGLKGPASWYKVEFK